MATYKEIRGTQIEAVATDPSNPVEGQVWYNTTSNVLKGRAVTASGSWASAPSLNTGRYAFSGVGNPSGALVAGGSTPGNSGVTESFNGSSWTEVNDLTTARNSTSQANSCTQTASLLWGGYPSYPGSYRTECESWNGTNWTEVNDLNYGQSNGGALGTQTAAISGGGTVQPGNPYSGDYSALTMSWNGSNWTAVNDINNARYGMNSTGAGSSTAGIINGGLSGPSPYTARAFTELWNGTNWTEVNDLNQARTSLNGGGASSTDAIVYGGEYTPPASNKTETELWNGTNWSETTDLPTATKNGTGAGATTSAFLAGGQAPGLTANTFAWTGPGAVQTRTFDDS